MRRGWLLALLSWVAMGCVRLSEARVDRLSSLFNSSTFPMSVDSGVSRLLGRFVIKELARTTDGARHFELTGATGREPMRCFISAYESRSQVSSSFALEARSDRWCADLVWPALDEASYARAQTGVEAALSAAAPEAPQPVAQPAPRQGAEATGGRASPSEPPLLPVAPADDGAASAPTVAFAPRWAPTGTLGFHLQTTGGFGVGGSLGLRRWSAPHLGWAVELAYDLETIGALTHQLALAPRLDVLWPGEGRWLPLGSVSFFAAPVLSVDAAGLAPGWRVGVRAAAVASDGSTIRWPLFLCVSYEETERTSARAAALRAVRFGVGLGL